jgi:dolichol-phosphate mannosyltransferase
MQSAPSDIVISVVLPFYNEEDCLRPVVDEARRILSEGFGTAWEIVMVDDGSTDRTAAILYEIEAGEARCRGIHLTANSGQSAALEAGFNACRGEMIATMDGDGQNDPADIRRLASLLHLREVDMVCGIRQRRADSLLRRWSSRLANTVRSAVLHDHITDVGCSLRVFRRACLTRIHFFRNAHRFFPALMIMAGYRVIETPVNHRPRLSGRSKYGMGVHSRLWAGLLDLAGVWWLRKRALTYRVIEDQPPVGETAAVRLAETWRDSSV